jgi:hypothetical protein
MIQNERWVVDGVEKLEEVLPDFEPMCLGSVRSLYLNFDRNNSITVQIRAEYCTPNRSDLLIELIFCDARQVSIPELGTLDLSELEVRDISDRQLEGLQREVVNHGPDRFSLLCRQVKMGAVLSQEGDTLKLLWEAR